MLHYLDLLRYMVFNLLTKYVLLYIESFCLKFYCFCSRDYRSICYVAVRSPTREIQFMDAFCSISSPVCLVDQSDEVVYVIVVPVKKNFILKAE